MVTKAHFVFGLLAFLFASWITGCTSPTFDSRNALLRHNASIDPSVVFLADNQKTLMISEPIVEQSGLFKEIPQASAHRGPAMENFSLDVVRHIVDRKGKGTQLTIHVGDLLNNSCRSEFRSAMDVLTAAKSRPIYIAPGNHDGFYLGITSPVEIESRSASGGLLNELGGWAQICTAAHKKKKNDDYNSDCPSDAETEGCDADKDYERYQRFETGKYLASKTDTRIDGYAYQTLDKYSYILTYLNELRLHEYFQMATEAYLDRKKSHEVAAQITPALRQDNTPPNLGNRLPHPDFTLGIPHVRAIFANSSEERIDLKIEAMKGVWKNVSDSRLYAYKINRLLGAIQSYHDVYAEFADFDWNSKLGELDKKVEEIGTKNRRLDNPGLFMEFYRDLAGKLEDIEDRATSHAGNDDIHWARLCAALLEADHGKFGPQSSLLSRRAIRTALTA